MSLAMTETRPAVPQPGVIAYLGRILPALSETFVIREVAALWQRGLVVHLLSLYPPDPVSIHPEIRNLGLQVTTIYEPHRPQFWWRHLYYLLARPRRYVSCLWRYVLRPAVGWQARLRCAYFFLMAPAAAWNLERQGIAHVHAHFANTPTSVALMAAALTGTPFSFMAHAYDVFVDTLLLPEKLQAAKFVATCSYFNVDYLRQHFPEAKTARLEVVRYGLDPVLFPFRRRTQRQEPPVILGVGRLVVTKGFHTLVAAMAHLRERGIPALCRIIGDGPEYSQLQHQIAAWQLQDRVELLGRRLPEETKAAYEQADILVMPSCVRNNDRDGIPNVLLEAMALGVPVVSTYVSGIPELVRHEETGLLVAAEDPPALAAALARLLQDPALAQRLAKRAREVVEQEFNIHLSAARLQELFASPTAARHI
jgi:glycosyltransferase involved in cell wall biosynthesis